MGVGCTNVDGAAQYACADHEAAATGAAAGGAAAQRGEGVVTAFNAVGKKFFLATGTCIDAFVVEGPCLRLCKQPVLYVVVVVEDLGGDGPTMAVELVDADKERLAERAGFIARIVGAKRPAGVRDRNLAQQGAVGLQDAQTAAARDVLTHSAREVYVELDAVLAVLGTVASPGVPKGVEVTRRLYIVERGEVAVHVGDTVQSPFDAVAAVVRQARLVAHAAVIAAVAVNSARLRRDFPIITPGTVAFADNLAEVALNHRVEAFFGFPVNVLCSAVGAVAEGLAFEEIAFRFFVFAEARNAPARLDVNALHGEAPAVPHKAAPAVAAVLQAGTHAEADAAGRGFERIGEICRTVLIGRRGFYLLNA